MSATRRKHWTGLDTFASTVAAFGIAIIIGLLAIDQTASKPNISWWLWVLGYGLIAAGIVLFGVSFFWSREANRPDERKEQIRIRLSELILDGDQAWNEASMAYQIWHQNQLRQPQQQSVPASPPDEPIPIPEWWKTEIKWLDQVESYLAATPEFGESEAAVFRAQEAALEPIPQGKAPLSTEVRTQQAMQLIRLKQDRLRKLLENLTLRP